MPGRPSENRHGLLAVDGIGGRKTEGTVRIVRALVNLCWYFFKWALVLGVVVALVVVPYLYRRVDEEIRRQIERKLAEHYPHLSVSVRAARLVEGEGIEIYGISIMEPGAEGPQAQLAHIEEIFASCGVTLAELLQKEPEFERVVVRRPKINCTHRPGGQWSAAQLLPLPKFGDRPPEILVENGSIEIFDPLRNPSTTLTYHDLNVELTPETPTDAYVDPSPTLRMQGHFTGDHLVRVAFTGTVSDAGARWSLGGTVEALELSPELHASLPGGAAEHLELLKSVRARAQLNFQLSRSGSPDEPLLFALEGRVVQGRIDDPRLPGPLNDLRATFRCDNQELVIDELHAQNGQTTLQLRARKEGFAETSPMQVALRCERLQLDHQLLAKSPDAWREHWNDFLPAGAVNVDLQARFDGNQWHPDVRFTCLDTSFTYHRFRYRLERARGTVHLQDRTLAINLKAYGGGEQIHIDGRFENLGPEFHGALQVFGDNLRLDQKLLDALPPKPREVVTSLQPSGKFSFNARFWREPGEVEGLHDQIQVRLNSCTINYEQFPYPLVNVRGTIEGQDDVWTFRNLEGTNDGGRVTCNGSLTPGDRGPQLVLRLAGEDVPLEEELRDALKPPLQRLWNDLKPRGTIDLDSEIRFVPADQKLSVWVRLVPLAESTSVEPRAFPLRLEDIRGAITYHDGYVQLDPLIASHGPMRIQTRGFCQMQPDGGWYLNLQNVAVDRLSLDRDLRQALSGQLRDAVLRLDPRGTYNLHGSLRMARGGGAESPLESDWDLRIDAHGAALECGFPIKHVHGSVNLTGGFDGTRFGSHGELNLDSLTTGELQVTRLRGPIWIDNERVLLGAWTQRRTEDAAPRHMTADVYGGKLYGDGWVTLDATSEYGLNATLVDADLTRTAQEVLSGQQKISGKLDGSIRLRGRGEGLHTLRGDGDLRLREAYVYELPQMIALLKILSVKPPDTTAFTSSEIDFRIEGDHIYFDTIDFYGDAISLKGNGEMNLDMKVGLNFYAVVGRDEINVPIVGDLLRGASEQIMMIRVDGKVDNPNIRREHFPGVNHVLQQLQAEMQRPRASQIPRAGQLPSRGWSPGAR